MKTKSRQSVASTGTSWSVTRVSDGQTVAEGSGSRSWTDKFESISYGQGFSRFNPCTHMKVSMDLITHTIQWRKLTTSDLYWDNDSGPGSYYDNPTDVLEWAKNVAGPPDWGNFAQRAIEAMTPTLESGFSLANFMYEIREIKQLVKWWNKGRTFLENLSNGTLNYNFGVRPFLSDIKHLTTGLFTVRDRLALLKAGAGKLQVRHYSEEDSDLVDEQSSTVGYTDYKTTLDIPLVTNTATMVYTYQMPDIDESLLQLYAILDSLGLNLNPAIVWDAVPYTFVVDWFINVGDFLSQLRKKWIPISIYIKDFCVSTKFTFTGDGEIRRTGKVTSDWWPRQSFWGKFYLRRPLVLDDRCFSPSVTGSLNLRKFVLGALLIKQRV